MLTLLLTSCLSAQPVVDDPRMQLTLFADSEQIVTPIGLAVGSDDAVYVIESHTHLPPAGYDGPRHDRIKRLTDTDGDGVCDRVDLFAHGLDAAMNLAFAPSGSLLVVCAREVLALPDADGDGVCDQPVSLLKLDTKERYPHNCLLGITCSADGWIYVSRGNMSSYAYTLTARDGTTWTGYGDGGNIVRIREDGSRLQHIATGFWNPFGIVFDQRGRLVCVDNDPDARGPNRIVHVVRDGDYGYRSLYGGSGTHPLQAWDGELPGRLPLAGATGEAPSGIIDSRRIRLPASYEQELLVTVWNENTIERHRVIDQGESFKTQRQVWIRGGKNFRPVGLDADSAGSLYISDWVRVDYPNHGHGRIWKLVANTDDTTTHASYLQMQQHALQAASGESPAAALRSLDPLGPNAPWQAEDLWQELASDDPWHRHLAITRLVRSGNEQIDAAMRHASTRVRSSALVAVRYADQSRRQDWLARGLSDSAEPVRYTSMVVAAEQMDVRLLPLLRQAVTWPNVSPRMIRMYREAAANCSQPFVDAYFARKAEKARDLPRQIASDAISSLVLDRRLPADARATALRVMGDGDVTEHIDLASLLESAATPLRVAAMDRLAGQMNDSSHRQGMDEKRQLLLHIANAEDNPIDLRVHALSTLARIKRLRLDDLEPFLEDANATVRLIAIRLLNDEAIDDRARNLLTNALRIAQRIGDSPMERQAAFALGRVEDRPTSPSEWLEQLRSGGNRLVGRYVFYSSRAMCYQCHAEDDNAITFGPRLVAGQSMRTREDTIRAILDPSASFPPQYQSWGVETTNGVTEIGLQLDHKAGGAIELLTTDRGVVHFEASQIEDFFALPRSLMPEGLEQNLSVEELRDLVAYLSEPAAEIRPR